MTNETVVTEAVERIARRLRGAMRSSAAAEELARLVAQDAAPSIAAKAVEEKEREIKALDEARFEAESREEELHDRLLVAEKRAEEVVEKTTEAVTEITKAHTEAVRRAEKAERERDEAEAQRDAAYKAEEIARRERERLSKLLNKEPGPYDRERFTITVCPVCGGRGLQTTDQRKADGTYCYCKVDGTTKGDPTRCEEVEAVAVAALDQKGDDHGGSE